MANTTLLLVTILALLVFFFMAMYLSERKELKELKVVQHALKGKFHSTTIKHGKNWEHFVPFMNNYPGDKENSVFIGNPIDYVSFGHNEIMFIEVKTGSSTLTDKQKRIKELVEQKKVEWREINDTTSTEVEKQPTT